MVDLETWGFGDFQETWPLDLLVMKNSIAQGSCASREHVWARLKPKPKHLGKMGPGLMSTVKYKSTI